MRTTYARAVGSGELSAMLWVGSRLLTLHERCGSRTQFVVREIAGARVTSVHTIEGSVTRAVATDEDLVVLVAGSERIQAAKLLVLQPDGDVRSVPLHAIAAGDEPTARGVRRSARPALAVDGRRAFVVPAVGPVAEIDLDGLSVSYHLLARRSLAARTKASEGWTRHAHYVDGVLAVSGRDEVAFEVNGTLHVRDRPAGLQLIDTRTWASRLVESAATWVTYGGGLLLATRHTWDSVEQKTTGMGIAAYDLEGRKRFHLFAGTVASVEAVHGGRLYARLGGAHSLRIVRVADGRILGTRVTPLPRLLMSRASSYWRNGI
jgi:hypothetical protein